MLILAFNSLQQEGKIIIVLHTKIVIISLFQYKSSVAGCTSINFMGESSSSLRCQCPSRL